MQASAPHSRGSNTEPAASCAQQRAPLRLGPPVAPNLRHLSQASAAPPTRWRTAAIYCSLPSLGCGSHWTNPPRGQEPATAATTPLPTPRHRLPVSGELRQQQGARAAKRATDGAISSAKLTAL
ncbi:hypothetical protein NDU88_010340 [Pleurodeles waltl]|uniref:Uncharacterized protein n=1 Tax=Pleurodeles waltl TaxID=8319 RepID=A0AAV7QVE1_PLEWA|nr:hypothetical protein NDU88_010340 [Pleurodeles waltl]